MRAGPFLVLTCLLGLQLVTASWGIPAPGSPKLAFVIVCDASNPQQVFIERRFADAVKTVRAQYGMDKSSLPIFTYHFDNHEEKSYCEQALGIRARDLVYIGIAEHQGTVIQKMLSHSTSVKDPESEGRGLFKRACLALGLDPATVDKSLRHADMAVPESTRASASLQVLDTEGRPATHFKTTEKLMSFSVRLSHLDAAAGHTHLLQVAVYSPSGKLLGSHPLGGTLDLAPGVAYDGTNALLLAGERRLGYPIRDTFVGAHPGLYRAQVTLDGAVVAQQAISIDAVPQARVGQLGLVAAYLISGHGNYGLVGTGGAATFSKADGSVAVIAVFNNLTPESAAQSHSVTVQLVNTATGQPATARSFGGSFQVDKGEDLTQKTFPGAADPQQSNGALVGEWAPGEYKAVLSVDGQTVRELPFQLLP